MFLFTLLPKENLWNYLVVIMFICLANQNERRRDKSKIMREAIIKSISNNYISDIKGCHLS